LLGFGSQSFTGIFTGLAARSEIGFGSDTACPLLANAKSADGFTLITMSEAMKQPFGMDRAIREWLQKHRALWTAAQEPSTE
jgi:hypothetical protein